jgi:hypothetical protein
MALFSSDIGNVLLPPAFPSGLITTLISAHKQRK